MKRNKNKPNVVMGLPKKMKILCVIGGGIGDCIQTTPTIKAIASEGHIVDVLVACNSSDDVSIFKLPCVNNVFYKTLLTPFRAIYDCVLLGPFLSPNNYNIGKINFSITHHGSLGGWSLNKPNNNELILWLQSKNISLNSLNNIDKRDRNEISDAEIFYNLAKQIGIQSPMKNTEIKIPTNGPEPPKNTVAIYPGSKENWSMKRWDKYDNLSKMFDTVALVGKIQDIFEHGNPPWIKKLWKWDMNKIFFVNNLTLSQMAYFISKCKMFIGNDGGMSHLAAATGIPTFVLFGPTSNINNKPYANNAFAISSDVHCRPCQFSPNTPFRRGGNNCPYKMRCMRKMSVEFVYSKIKNLISLDQ